ncbi:unnamed protein product [Polarella glacialis]|uniref:Uncharacterized protein n=1 Tax=Polarella glacialis TaxID=89957 RepID=A0A813HKF8_POLGL|nr:unnamed protein product [Polarella glacialis]
MRSKHITTILTTTAATTTTRSMLWSAMGLEASWPMPSRLARWPVLIAVKSSAIHRSCSRP